VIALLALSLGVVVPAPAAVSTVPPTAAAPAATGGNPRLQALLDELVDNGASGALALVDDGQHVWRLSSGAVRLDPYQALRPDARFRIASVTKTFVATAALQLVGEGKLRLGHTVER
jgi:D-alanyl-D-alanine carboxypeptidase